MLRGRVLYLVAGCWMAFIAIHAFADLAFGVDVPPGTKMTFAIVSAVFAIWLLVTAKPRSNRSKLKRRK